jgi:hypothetical protein
MLRRFWFKFAPLENPHPLNLGCGVTAMNLEDALRLLDDLVFSREGIVEVVEIVEDVDVSTLDPKHVLPNMRPAIFRGVWFPQCY